MLTQRQREVYEFVVKEFAKHGWSYTSQLAGHGVGCWWHQQEPVIARGAKIVLEEGMVLALEPAKDYYHIQDMVVVRTGRPEWISDKFATDEMFVIA